MNNFIEQYWVDDNTIDCLSELANNCNGAGLLQPGKIGVDGQVDTTLKNCFEVNISQVPPQVCGDQFVSYGLDDYKGHLMDAIQKIILEKQLP